MVEINDPSAKDARKNVLIAIRNRYGEIQKKLDAIDNKL